MMYYVPHSDSIRRLDRFKTLVLMLMVGLLIPVLWIGREQAQRDQPLPEAPVTPAPPPPVSLDTPADGSTFSTDSATLVGTGTAGDKLELIVNGQLLAQLIVSIDGGWRYDLPMPAAGDYRIIVRLLGADGSANATTNPIIVTRLPSLQPMKPPTIVAPAPGQAINAGPFEFRGGGEPNHSVVLVIDGVEGGKASIGADGSWALSASAAPGEHDVHAYSLDENGNALMSGTLRLTVKPGSATATAADADADGVDDAADKCAGTESGATVDSTGCVAVAAATVVQALTDEDDDGVADGEDRCPATVKGTQIDEQGCPRHGETLMTVTGLTFENNRAELGGGSAQVLDRAVQVLRDNASVNVVIEGHTDDRGDAEYNRQLSQQRAETVRDYLIAKGISADRLQAVGKGESEPLVDNRTENDRKKNRRVEIVVN